MLNLERLRVLHAVATAGSIRGAAEALHVTASAVSQQLARLEREVAQPLIEPRGRGIALTAAAVLLAEHAGRLLTHVETIEADLAGHRSVVSGTLAVAAFATAARGLLPAALRALRAEHPDLVVRMSEQEPDAALTALLRTDVDVAVVQDWPEAPIAVPSTVSRCALLADTLDAALPAGHPLAGRAEIDLAELRDQDWISWADGERCHDWIVATLRARGVEPRILHTASEHSTQLALVAAGLGTALVPRLGRDVVPAGVHIVAVPDAPARQVHVLWRTSAARRPAVHATVEAIRAAAPVVAGAAP